MHFFSRNIRTVCYAIITLAMMLPAVISAQTKKKPVKKATTKAAVAAPTPTAAETVVTTVPSKEPTKRNDRGGEGPVKTADIKTAAISGTRYSYTFDRPGFTYSKIVIEHDDSGKGTILMKLDKEDEPFTDPIQLSPATLGSLKKTFGELNFLDSSDDYQHARDYKTLGDVTITLSKDGRSRTAKFNWSENAGARLLMDEYRRISNEYTWKFEMQSARENQPLSTPGLVDAMAGYVDRSEISDPPHLLPLLTELSQDERLPLMARNRIKKILVKIGKNSK